MRETSAKIQGAVFDVDGTLLDSMYVWKDVGDRYLRSKGVVPQPDMEERVRTMSMPQVAEYCRREYGLTESPQQIIDEINGLVLQSYREEVQPKKGVPELLDALKARGIKLAVATASDRCLIESALERTGLLPRFDVFLTCTEVGEGKDSPAIFYKAAELLACRPEDTVIFEDSLYAMKTAKAAGFRVAAIADASAAHEEKEIQETADWFVEEAIQWLTALFPNDTKNYY